MLDTLSTQVVLNVRYEQLVPRFLEQRRSELSTIDHAINAGDFATVARIGHNLHGAGASYGLDGLSLFGAQLEEAALQQDSPALFQIYAGLVNYLESVEVTYRNSVLFVDDQPEILTLLRRLFSEGEYICYFANDAAQALEILDQHPVDVMVSDLVMPDMGGLELLGLVRQRHPQVVRLVLSGQSQVPSILAAIKAGQIFRYLTKPWRVDAEARQTIHEAMQYANETQQTGVRQIHLTPDTLVEVLSRTGSRFVLQGQEGRVLGMGGEQAEEVAEALMGPEGKVGTLEVGITKFVLDRQHSLWLW